MVDIQKAAPKSSSKSPKNQTHIVFSWSQTIRDCLWIVALAILLGGALNYTLLLDAIDGKLIAGIQQKQLTDLRQKAEQLYPGISFIDLVSAKKLYSMSWTPHIFLFTSIIWLKVTLFAKEVRQSGN